MRAGGGAGTDAADGATLSGGSTLFRFAENPREALEKGDTRLTVVLGTKGGRPRDTIIQDTGAVKQALDKAIVVAERRNGRLIDAASLKQAMKYWRNQTLRMGLTGKYSPHSLRYARRRTISAGIWRRGSAKRSAGDGGNGPRAWRRAWSLGEAGVCTE